MRKTTLAAAAAAALLAAPPLAHADTLAGGPVYGYAPDDRFTGCFLFNAGPAAVALSGLAIVGQGGQSVTPYQNSCGASLGAGQICGIVGIIPRNGPYACTVTTPAGAGAYLRGAVGTGSILDPASVTVPLQLTPSG